MAWGPSRRFLVGHVWCTVTRHRLRACMMQSRVMNYRGYVPWCLWVRPTNVGERVWLLMRPGICVDDLDTRTPQIAAACWARDARVRAWRRLVSVVLVDVVRRDPLTAGKLVGSPLPSMAGGSAPAGLAAIPVDLGDGDDQVDRLGVVRPVLSDECRGLGARPGRVGCRPERAGASADPAGGPQDAAGFGQVVFAGNDRHAGSSGWAGVRPVGAGAVSSSGEDVTDYV